jgi:hypothetical protein
LKIPVSAVRFRPWAPFISISYTPLGSKANNWQTLDVTMDVS